jgi:CDP-2,3-bis-(O-geranylgeranyl)-sn-glycerol synthase
MAVATIAGLLVLLAVANGTPMLAAKLLGRRFAYPLDGGLRFIDGRPLLGRSKTVRGVALSLLATTAAAPFLGFEWGIGLRVGAFAMIGDLFSSFCKRRLGRASSSPALGLDQIPESLLPLLACRGPLALTAADIATGVIVFFVGEVLLSRLLYAFDLRERPY